MRHRLETSTTHIAYYLRLVVRPYTHLASCSSGRQSSRITPYQTIHILRVGTLSLSVLYLSPVVVILILGAAPHHIIEDVLHVEIHAVISRCFCAWFLHICFSSPNTRPYDWSCGISSIFRSVFCMSVSAIQL